MLLMLVSSFAAVKDGNGTLLDNTTVLYGGSNSNTHNNLNYPLILADGKNSGIKHGEHHRFEKTAPLSNPS